MKLYFLRHATATRSAASDAERPLTPTGEEEARWAGMLLRKLGAEPDQIVSSPLVRALQTARLAAEAMKFKEEIKVLDEMKYDVSTSEFFRALKPYAGVNRLLLVGHAPSMPRQIAELVGASHEESIALGKGGIACLEVPRLAKGGGVLRWLLRPKQVRLLAE